MNDGHFYWQSCYQGAFATIHYFPIVALQAEQGDDTAIYLAPNLPLYAGQNGLLDAFSTIGYNLSELAGAQVMAIEGQSPWDYLDQVAGPASGTYQDPEQRVNYQLASYTSIFGGLGIAPGQFAQTTSFDKDNITLSVKTVDGQETDIVSPWLSTYQSKDGWQFQSGEEL